MTERDKRGRFCKGNTVAAAGGAARAVALTPEQRSHIARLGWLAFVAKYFGGREDQARRWWGEVGAEAAERMAFAGTGIYKPHTWPRPPSLPR
jgi:hypothetical protein